MKCVIDSLCAVLQRIAATLQRAHAALDIRQIPRACQVRVLAALLGALEQAADSFEKQKQHGDSPNEVLVSAAPHPMRSCGSFDGRMGIRFTL